jgi:hypothetical protein
MCPLPRIRRPDDRAFVGRLFLAGDDRRRLITPQRDRSGTASVTFNYASNTTMSDVWDDYRYLEWWHDLIVRRRWTLRRYRDRGRDRAGSTACRHQEVRILPASRLFPACRRESAGVDTAPNVSIVGPSTDRRRLRASASRWPLTHCRPPVRVSSRSAFSSAVRGGVDGQPAGGTVGRLKRPQA